MDIDFFLELHNSLPLEMRLTFLRNTIKTDCNTLEEYWETEEGKIAKQKLIDKFNSPPPLVSSYKGQLNPFVHNQN